MFPLSPLRIIQLRSHAKHFSVQRRYCQWSTVNKMQKPQLIWIPEVMMAIRYISKFHEIFSWRGVWRQYPNKIYIYYYISVFLPQEIRMDFRPIQVVKNVVTHTSSGDWKSCGYGNMEYDLLFRWLEFRTKISSTWIDCAGRTWMPLPNVAVISL